MRGSIRTGAGGHGGTVEMRHVESQAGAGHMALI